MSINRTDPRRRTWRSVTLAIVSAVATAAVTFLVGLSSQTAQAAAGAGAGYWHTSGNQILDANNTAVRIAGINWYGFETDAKVAHGLYAQDYHDIIDTIKRLGYNTVRLPFSNDVIEHPIQSDDIGWANGVKATNLDLKGLDSMQVMDKLIGYMGQVGLKVILDNHRSDAGNSAQENGLWYTSAYPHQTWLNDWATIARRYAGNTTVVGYDLRNEPHTPDGSTYEQGATWGTGNTATDWRLAAEAAGNLLLGINPNALIFVEGIGQSPNASGGMDATWWGGDLVPVAQYPVRLNVANRLVYSPHDYGPRLYRQSWFNANTTQASLAAVWDRFWGYIHRQSIAPIMVGEFGTTNNAEDIASSSPGSQGQWFSAMITYLKNNPTMGWTYWAFNGNDDFGLVDAQFNGTPVSSAKQQLLASIQFPLPGAANPTATTTTQAPASSSSRPPGGTVSDIIRPSSSSPSRSSASPSRSSASPSRSPSTPGGGTVSDIVRPSSSSASARPPSGCRVTYSRQSEWPGGFVANITITNAGAGAFSGWTLTLTFPGDQKITNSWNATVTQTGAGVTATNLSWNGSLPGGASTSFGLQGTWTTSDASPTSFAVNGMTCTA